MYQAYFHVRRCAGLARTACRASLCQGVMVRRVRIFAAVKLWVFAAFPLAGLILCVLCVRLSRKLRVSSRCAYCCEWSGLLYHCGLMFECTDHYRPRRCRGESWGSGASLEGCQVWYRPAGGEVREGRAFCRNSTAGRGRTLDVCPVWDVTSVGGRVAAAHSSGDRAHLQASCVAAESATFLHRAKFDEPPPTDNVLFSS